MMLKNKENSVEENSPEENKIKQQHNFQFFQEYKKIYTTSYHLSLQIKSLISLKDELWKKLLKFQQKAEDEFKDHIRGELPEKRKRNRRTADEIQKIYTCQVQRCQRSYGSEGSLMQHIKLKHPQLHSLMLKQEEQVFIREQHEYEDEEQN